MKLVDQPVTRLKHQQAFPEWLQQLGEHSSQRLQQDLLHQLLLDWSLRLALQVGLLLELVRGGCPAAPGSPGGGGCCPGAKFVAGGCCAAAAGFVGA